MFLIQASHSRIFRNKGMIAHTHTHVHTHTRPNLCILSADTAFVEARDAWLVPGAIYGRKWTKEEGVEKYEKIEKEEKGKDEGVEQLLYFIPNIQDSLMIFTCEYNSVLDISR